VSGRLQLAGDGAESGAEVSYHLDVPSGPAIVLVAALGYLASVLFGPGDSLRALYFRRAAVWRPDRRFSADAETSGQLRLFYSTTMTRKTRHGAKG
jgi:hypothetical protein